MKIVFEHGEGSHVIPKGYFQYDGDNFKIASTKKKKLIWRKQNIFMKI
jgi:hypothetical protein